MKKLISVLLCLHVVALHTSIAAMEIFSWLTFLVVVGELIYRRERPKFPLAAPLLGLVALVGVSLLANPSLRPFWFQFGFMRWIFLFWGFQWAFELVWSPEFERKLVRVWTVVMAITAAYALLQFFTGVDFIRDSAQTVFPQGGGVYKAVGFFSFSLTYAYMIGISLLAVSLPALAIWPRGVAVGSWIVGAMGVIASMSKGAWIAVVAAAFIYIASVKRRLVPAFLAAVGAVGAGLAVWSEPFRTKLTAILTFHPDHSADVRLDLWRSYGHMFLDHPWTGVGLFQGDKLLPEYYARLGIQQEFTSHAHNVLIQWAAGAGIFALLCYLWFAGAMLRKTWRLRSVSVWGWSLLMAQIFFHLGGLTETNFFDGEVNHLFVFVLAIAAFQSSQFKAESGRHLKVQK